MFSLCSRFSVEYSVMNTMRWNYKPIVTSSLPPQVLSCCVSLAVRFIYVACSYVALTTPFCNFRHNTDLWQQLNLWNTTIIINGAKRFPVLRWVFGQLGLKQQKQKRFQVVRDHASYIYFKLAWQKKTWHVAKQSWRMTIKSSVPTEDHSYGDFSNGGVWTNDTLPGQLWSFAAGRALYR